MRILRATEFSMYNCIACFKSGAEIMTVSRADLSISFTRSGFMNDWPCKFFTASVEREGGSEESLVKAGISPTKAVTLAKNASIGPRIILIDDCFMPKHDIFNVESISFFVSTSVSWIPGRPWIASCTRPLAASKRKRDRVLNEARTFVVGVKSRCFLVDCRFVSKGVNCSRKIRM